jgi:hypothetical protein
MAYNDPLRDITREMIDKMYENKTKKLIREEFDEKIELKEDEAKEEEKKFRETVSPRVEFKKFFIYPKAFNVEWAGKFTSSNLEWVYSLDTSNGVYITGDLVQLDDDTMEILKKLVGYYETWSNEWANKIADNYESKSKESGEETI